MKGRDSFSQSEAAQIRELLDEKIKSGNLKPFRDSLRSLGFYISDFERISTGFSREDFDELVRKKRITIYENPETAQMTVKLAQTDAERAACFPVMQELRTHLGEAEFLAQVKRQEASGYRLAYVVGEGQVVAVAGFHIEEALAWGKYMYVYDLVSSSAARSQGHGKALIDFLKGLALEAGCAQLHLDSGVQRFAAHKFYLREGFVISAHHFQLSLD